MYRVSDVPNPLKHHPVALEKVALQAEDLLSDGEGDGGTDKLMMAMAMSSMTGDGQGQDGQMLYRMCPIRSSIIQ